jgi:hypothetical protein
VTRGASEQECQRNLHAHSPAPGHTDSNATPCTTASTRVHPPWCILIAPPSMHQLCTGSHLQRSRSIALHLRHALRVIFTEPNQLKALAHTCTALYRCVAVAQAQRQRRLMFIRQPSTLQARGRYLTRSAKTAFAAEQVSLYGRSVVRRPALVGSAARAVAVTAWLSVVAQRSWLFISNTCQVRSSSSHRAAVRIGAVEA